MASDDLSTLTADQLREKRHELANRVQSLTFRLWMIDDAIELRRRMAELDGRAAYLESGMTESSQVGAK